MSFISVIIPAYNAGKYIENCINSILKQTYNDYEIIVVNDGSTDNTAAVLNRLMQQDKRIHVLTQKNAGVSSARNAAVKAAKGDFITFVDADDDIPQNAFADMIALMTDKVDLVIGTHNEVRLREEFVPIKEMKMSASEIVDNFIEYNKYIRTPVAKLFRKSIIEKNNIAFKTDTDFGEDHIFLIEYSKYIENNVVIKNKCFYNYRILHNGLCFKYHENMHALEKQCILAMADFFGCDEKFNKICKAYYVKCYILGCIDYYIVRLPLKKAKEKVRETIELYNDLLNDEMLKDMFSKKQYDLIKNNDFDAFTLDYISRNFKNILKRKIRMFIRKVWVHMGIS